MNPPTSRTVPRSIINQCGWFGALEALGNEEVCQKLLPDPVLPSFASNAIVMEACSLSAVALMEV